MKITYDPAVDALYISFKKSPTQVTTIRVNEDVAVDLSPSEEIAGIEILSASDYLEFVKKKPMVELENLNAA